MALKIDTFRAEPSDDEYEDFYDTLNEDSFHTEIMASESHPTLLSNGEAGKDNLVITPPTPVEAKGILKTARTISPSGAKINRFNGSLRRNRGQTGIKIILPEESDLLRIDETKSVSPEIERHSKATSFDELSAKNSNNKLDFDKQERAAQDHIAAPRPIQIDTQNGFLNRTSHLENGSAQLVRNQGLQYARDPKDVQSLLDLTTYSNSATATLRTSASSALLSQKYYPRQRRLPVYRKGQNTKVITPRSNSESAEVYPKMKGEVEPEETEQEFYERIFKEWEEQDRLSDQPASWHSTLLWFPFLALLRYVNFVLSVMFWPISIVLRYGFGTEIESVSFWDVPLEKKKQTTLVFAFIMMLPFILFAYTFSFFALIFPLTTVPMFLYLLFMFRIDKSPWTGSRQPFMRYWKMWRHFVNYFPIRLIKTHNFDPNEKYVLCYHPHGIISLGAFGNFATDATGFSRKFPGIDLRVLTLEINFYVPFLREILLSLGICNCSWRACNQILGRRKGSAILLVVGGAAESLQSAPGTYRLNVDHKGFVRVALQNGANLVPVLGFGETDAFSTHVYPDGSTIKWFQDKFKDTFGFAPPIFYGEGLFNEQIGMMPHRTPIIVVVGKPIKVPKVPPHLSGSNLKRTAEGRKLVEEYHEKYIQALRELYDQYKNKWAINRSESLLLLGRNLPN